MIVVKQISEQLDQWKNNPGSLEKLNLLLTDAVYLVLYLDLWPRKCCIVICSVIVNAILVVQRRIDRSSHRICSYKFLKVHSKIPVPEFLLQEILLQVFSCEFSQICGTTFFQNTFGRLLLYLEPFQISMIEHFCRNTGTVAQRCSLKRCS